MPRSVRLICADGGWSCPPETILSELSAICEGPIGEDAGSDGDMGSTDGGVADTGTADMTGGDVGADLGGGVMYELTLTILGQGAGSVSVSFPGATDSCAAPGTCTYMVPESGTVTLSPMPAADATACPRVSPAGCMGVEGDCTFDMLADDTALIQFNGPNGPQVCLE